LPTLHSVRISLNVTQPSSLALSLASFHAFAKNSAAVMVTRGSSLFAMSAGNSHGESLLFEIGDPVIRPRQSDEDTATPHFHSE
jgi:hypothetical protein